LTIGFCAMGCKGFSYFSALVLCAGKNRSAAKPPHLRRDKLCSPAFRQVAEPVEALAEGGAQKMIIK
jgi:hypothetical protein